MKKLIIIFAIISLVSTNSYGFFCDSNGWAIDNSQKDPICEQTPEVIEEYIQDMVYIISMLPINETKYKNVEWLWSKALDTVGGAAQTTEQIFSDFGTNFFSNFFILFQDKQIVRDRLKILNLKEYLSNKVMKNIKWNLNNSIDAETLKKIKQYTDEKKSFVIKFKWTTFKEVTNYIWTNQQAVEDIYYNITRQWDDGKDATKNTKSKEWIFEVNQKHINELSKAIEQAYYKDGKIPNCNTTWDSFIWKVKEVVCTFGQKKTDDALERFSCNYDRLRAALFWEQNGSTWKCGNVQPAKMIPLKDRIKVNPYSLWKIEKDAKEMAHFLTWTFNDTVKWVWDLFNSKAEATSDVKVPITQNPSKLYKSMLEANLAQAANDTNTALDQVNDKLSKVESSRYTHDMTRQFSIIWQKVFKLRKEIDGAWEDYEDSAAWKLTEACNNQSPYIWECKKTKQ